MSSILNLVDIPDAVWMKRAIPVEGRTGTAQTPAYEWDTSHRGTGGP
jgi:hypothetical protein